MTKTILQIHRFLVQQSLYPLAFASFVSSSVFIVRVYLTGSMNYSNLAWNLVLAWIPYMISFVAAALEILLGRAKWLHLPLMAAWLLFFPNAPYIVTDFYHLELRRPIPLWFDIGLISLFAFSGCFLAIASLRTMQFIVRRYVGKILSWAAVIIAMAFSAVGVYLGRFSRWNSWDFFTNPRAILKEIAIPALSPTENLGFIGFTLLFTVLLFVLYLMFVSFNQKLEDK